MAGVMDQQAHDARRPPESQCVASAGVAQSQHIGCMGFHGSCGGAHLRLGGRRWQAGGAMVLGFIATAIGNDRSP